MTGQPPHSYADDPAWKLDEICDYIRSEIERLGPDSGNHTFRDGRHDAFVMLRAFIRGPGEERRQAALPEGDLVSVETRAYDKPNDDGFPPDPVVVLVATGTTDVSRLVNALARGNSEQIRLAERISRQLRRHNAGRAALSLLKAHGGADFTEKESPGNPYASLAETADARSVIDVPLPEPEEENS